MDASRCAARLAVHNGEMKRIVQVVAAAIFVFLVWAVAPYWMPTTIALGPCGRDWTSPTSYGPKASPMRQVTFRVGDTDGKLCYGSPAVRGRDVFGELVPWGELWRTGANEPTRLFVNGAIALAGIELEAGRYSIYTIPDAESWQLFVSRSTFHWGNLISDDVRHREVGTADLPSTSAPTFVEQMTFQWEPHGATGGLLALEWEDTRLEIPVNSSSPAD